MVRSQESHVVGWKVVNSDKCQKDETKLPPNGQERVN